MWSCMCKDVDNALEEQYQEVLGYPALSQKRDHGGCQTDVVTW